MCLKGYDEKGDMVMMFQGEVLSVAALLDAAQAMPETALNPKVGVGQTAAMNAATCLQLISDDEALDES